MGAEQVEQIRADLDQRREADKLEIRTRNFLINRCEACGREMLLRGGDVLYERRWFHGPCWKLAGKIPARDETVWVASLPNSEGREEIGGDV